MLPQLADMELNDRDRDVLAVLSEGRANPKLVRDETDLDKGDVNTVLVRLGRSGYVRQVTRGLYEITDDGRVALRDASDVSREPVSARSHETYEQPHWETAHVDRIDQIGSFESPDNRGDNEVIRVDFDGFGHGGASMHGVDENIQVSFWLTKPKAQALYEDIGEFMDN